jgi:hypothetical protein
MMMLDGGRTASRQGHEPRVVQFQISRYSRALPTPDEPLEFLVALHMEGTASTWQHNTALRPDDEQRLLAQIDDLRRWSAGLGMTPSTAKAAVQAIGCTLRDAFLGRKGRDVLAAMNPTAILMMIDETVIHLPWEMMPDDTGDPLIETPFSRVITTRVVAPQGRDLDSEDPRVRVLAVENPTEDLAATERVLEVVNGLRDSNPGVEVEVTTLERAHATRHGFLEAVTGQDFDIIHFAGHGHFDSARAHDNALVLADGLLTDDQVMKLSWSRPPFVVLNSSCESARAGAGRRVVSKGRANGLAAAFIGRGVEAYIGHYFLVDDAAAAAFSSTFYETLLNERNIGAAVQRSRDVSLRSFGDNADLTGFGAVFFGDAGGATRRDTATRA